MLYKSLTPVAISYVTNSLISIVNQHWYLTVLSYRDHYVKGSVAIELGLCQHL